MQILILLVFISLVFVVGSLLFYAWILKERTYEHMQRLTLLPLDDASTKPHVELPDGDERPIEPAGSLPLFREPDHELPT